MDKLDFQEKVWGGIFAIIAVAAAIVEMFIGGADAAAIVGAVKDVFGTLVVIVLFVTVIKSLTVKKPKNFREALNVAMEQVEENYYPLIRKAVERETDSEAKTQKLNAVIRYEIASKTDVLFNKSQKEYPRFFDINAEHPSNITFFVTKTFFGETPECPYDAEKIAMKISASLATRFPEYKFNRIDVNGNRGIVVEFGKELSTYDDAETLSKLIDITTLLFVAENKKV